MNAIFGFSGFVGSHLTTKFQYTHLYNTTNIEKSKNSTFDIIHICCIPSVKWKANKFPEKDFETIESIKDIFNTIKANKVILISTIDVYDKINNEDNEDSKINYSNNHTYGKNRFLFEKFILETFNNVNIIRLPALFGRGLKKNIIYDLLNNNNVHKIDKTSKFQWYNLEWLKEDIDYVIRNNIKICNFFTEPLETFEILKLFKYDYNNNPSFHMIYNTKSKYFDNGYIRSKYEVLKSIKEFVKIKNIPSNFCISNIANCLQNNLQFYNILKHYGFKNIELALTKYGDWNSILNTDLITKEIETIKQFDLETVSIQSITYTLKHNIFSEDKKLLLAHMKKVVDLCITNNIKNIVFGCPKNRIITKEEDKIIFINFFNEIGNYIAERNLVISIENNSKRYGCNFLNTISEVGDIVREIDNKNIKMMIDVGNCEMEKDNLNDIFKSKDIINHIHCSEPFMKGIKSSKIDFRKILEKIEYKKIISFEFLTENFERLNSNIKNIM